MKAPRIVRVPAEVSRRLRETARLAGIPVEEVMRAAFVYFARLEPDIQCRMIRLFWSEAPEPREAARNGLVRRVFAAVARRLPGSRARP